MASVGISAEDAGPPRGPASQTTGEDRICWISASEAASQQAGLQMVNAREVLRDHQVRPECRGQQFGERPRVSTRRD
jgi:hypothetical protein